MDKYPLVRKGLAVGIILLFVGTAIISTTAQDTEKPSLLTSSGNWLYVGGSGPGNYTRIQDAVDNASDGDTVFVFNGTYYETIDIANSISLIGEDKNTTVIDGSSSGSTHVVGINVNNVKIAGFMIIKRDFGIGIGSHFNIITGNIICFNNHAGIYANRFGSSNIIMGNTLFENGHGILLEYGCSEVDIIDNFIYSNRNGISIGVSVSTCTITGNVISINRGDGIFIYISPNNLIRRNTFQHNYDNGVDIHGSCDNNRIEENNFIGNYNINAWDNFNRETIWLGNYWDDWIGLKFHGPICQKFPKIIPAHSPPFVNFDWHPAKEPYAIP